MKSQASGPLGNQTPEEHAFGATVSTTEIVLFCHAGNVQNLVHAFADQIAHAAGALPLSIVWSGTSRVLRQGVIVLKAEGDVPPTFLHDLTIDQEIFDAVVYSWGGDNSEKMQAEKPGAAEAREMGK